MKIKAFLLALFALVATAPQLVLAQATPIDVSDAVAQISAVETALIAVGGAIIILAAVSVGFKWVKGMIFG